MDKNIAALLRTDAITIQVRFFKDSFQDYQNRAVRTLLGPDGINPTADLSDKSYLYVTHLQAKVGDLVVVDAAGIPKVAVVVKVHDSVMIEPESTTLYKWVISVVDREAYFANKIRNEQIEAIAYNAYKDNLKKRFREIVINQLDPKMKRSLTRLL